jgi:hypothetical protein
MTKEKSKETFPESKPAQLTKIMYSLYAESARAGKRNCELLV